MDALWHAIQSHNLELLIQTVSYIGVFGIVFVESGLLIGFFLPGDSLLFTAGLLAYKGYLDIYTLALGSFIAAVAGDSLGYFIGHKLGRKLFNREDSLLFHKDHLKKAEDFYEQHGGKTIILARFMPIIRTFAPVVAGIGKMQYRTFLFFNIIGGLLWAVGVTVAGYYLGSIIPDIDKYLLPIIGLIVLISVGPPLYHIFKEPENRAQIMKLLSRRK